MESKDSDYYLISLLEEESFNLLLLSFYNGSNLLQVLEILSSSFVSIPIFCGGWI